MVEPVGLNFFRSSDPEFRAPRVRGGFSFVEILFAVMILGIGFILIAGIFPVAINQTQANGDETIAATTARAGAAIIANLPNTAAYMVADGNVHRFGPGGPSTTSAVGDPDGALWRELNGSQIVSEDPRYAWVPFYCRLKDANGLPADFAQITIISVRVRNHDAYVPSGSTGGDLAITSGSATTALATLIGAPVTITVVSASNSLAAPDRVTLAGSNTSAAVPGTFVVIASDPGANANYSAVGWVLKLGTPTTTPNVFFLQPGGDMKNSTQYKPAPTAAKPLTAFIVGQGADPNNLSTYTGGAQDIMAYTTFIPLH